MKDIYLLRHGDIGSEKRYIGKTDICLSPVGERQIRELRKKITTLKFDLLYASPLLRCRQTAGRLELDQPIHYDERLREIDFGAWEGKTFAEISATDPHGVAQWSEGDTDFNFPEGEKIGDFRRRITAFGHKLHTISGQNILIISHGGVIRHLICNLLHLPYEKYLIFQIDYGRISHVQLFREGGILAGLNRRGV